MTCAPDKLQRSAAGRVVDKRVGGAPERMRQQAMDQAQGALPAGGGQSAGDGRR